MELQCQVVVCVFLKLPYWNQPPTHSARLTNIGVKNGLSRVSITEVFSDISLWWTADSS